MPKKQFKIAVSLGFAFTYVFYLSACKTASTNYCVDPKYVVITILLMLLLSLALIESKSTALQIAFAEAMVIGIIQLLSVYSITGQAKEYGISLIEAINSSWFRGGTFLSLATLLGGNVIGGMFGLSTILTWWLFWMLSPKTNTVVVHTAILDICLQLGLLILVNVCVDRLSEENAAAFGAAKKARKLKVDFISKMSHDMKTPLYGILGSIKLLMDSSKNEEQLEILRLLQTCANTLERFVSDLLDSVADSKMSMVEKQFSLTDALRCLTRMLNDRAIASNRSLKVVIDPLLPECAFGDMPRVQQLFIHLFNNAVKFTTPHKGEVEITIGCGLNEGTGDQFQVDFSVRDNGVGISQEELATLNQVLANPSEVERDSVGIGLSVVPRIIHRMNGEVVCDSKENEGTVFHGHFYLAFGTEKRKYSPAKPIVPKGLILVVEDNQVNQRIMNHLLVSLGFPNILAENGQQAVELFRLHKKELIMVLMDIHMPVMDGLTATGKIRDLEATEDRRIPIIAVTAGVVETEVHTLKEAGLDGYLPKPVKREQLLKFISQFTSL